MKKLIFLIIIFIVSNFNSYSQDVQFDSLVYKGIDEIYGIKFQQAENTFRQLIADNPEHPAGRFFLAMIDWWKILLDIDDESNDDIFFQKLEDVIYFCDEILDEEPDNVDALFFKGGAIGFRGRLRSIRESWIKAADDGRTALPIVERAGELDPDNVDVQLGFGIYNYYASVIPDEYPMIKPLMIFFPSGDKELGIEQLNNTAVNGKYAKYEARYFLMTLFYNYENNPYKAEEYADMLVKDFPDNPTFERWKGRINAKQGDYLTASRIFKDVLQKSEDSLTGYSEGKVKREATYYIGLQYRNEGKLDSAQIYFEKCADVSRSIENEDEEESGFLINSILYLAMIHEQRNEDEEAKRLYESLLEMREYGQSHKIAERYLKNDEE